MKPAALVPYTRVPINASATADGALHSGCASGHVSGASGTAASMSVPLPLV